MRKFFRRLAALTVFMGGYELTLPGVGLGVRVSIAYGVFLGNLLVIAYLLLFTCAGGLPRLKPLLLRTRIAALFLLVASLGLVGILSAGVNATTVLDFGQAARLALYGIYFVLAAYWARTYGVTFPLRLYLLGSACGGLVNLYYTVRFPPSFVFDVLPGLYSGNGAGGTLGVSCALAAWLWMLRRERFDGPVAILVTAVGVTCAALSYSKTAMLIAFIGLLAWSTVLFRREALPAWRRGGVLLLLLLALFQYVKPFGREPLDVVAMVQRAVAVKFGNMTLDKKFGIDDYNITGSRYAYWPMTFRVLADHPLLGVGYSGLYEAYGRARKGYEELALYEEPESRGTNPHNSFLYYVGSNGLPGLVLVVLIFAQGLRALLRSCLRFRLQGAFLWTWLAAAYLIYGFTLPTLFNTEILYVPAAVALIHAAERRASESAAIMEPGIAFLGAPEGSRT